MLDRKLAGQINRPLGMPDAPRMRYEAALGSPWYWSCSARDLGKLTPTSRTAESSAGVAERMDHVPGRRGENVIFPSHPGEPGFQVAHPLPEAANV